MTTFTSIAPGRLAGAVSGRRPGPSIVRLACRLLLPAVLALAGLPVLATDYGFSGRLPQGCTGSQGSYSCGALTLGAGDTISVNTATTIVVSGMFTAGAGVQINPGGKPSDLSIAVAGETDIGAGSTVNANVSGAGVVTLGGQSRFTGNITTGSAAINIGDFSVIDGSLGSSVAGVVNVGANSRVTGNISTLSGAINVGASSRIDGSLSTALAGAITLGAGASVGGNISTVSGAVSIGAESNVIGYILSTVAGAVTIGEKARVGGSVSTNSGAITLTARASSGGSVCTGLAGAITLNDNVKVGGNLSTNAGAITVGDLTMVAGNIRAMVGAITVAPSARTGAVVSTLKCPFDPPAKPAAPPVVQSREWRQIFLR